MRFWKSALLTLGGVSTAVVVGFQIIYHLTGEGAVSFAAIAAAAQSPPSNATAPIPTRDADSGPHTWWAGDSDGHSCHTGVSPAEAIRAGRVDGSEPQTTDHRDAQGQLSSVDVTRAAGDLGQSLTTTFYLAQSDCENALRKNRSIPDQYR